MDPSSLRVLRRCRAVPRLRARERWGRRLRAVGVLAQASAWNEAAHVSAYLIQFTSVPSLGSACTRSVLPAAPARAASAALRVFMNCVY